MMKSKDSRLKSVLVRLAEKQDLVKFHFKRASDLHILAAYGCWMLESKARPAIPALTELLREGNSLAPIALVSIGPEGVRALTGELTNSDAAVRGRILLGLTEIGIRRCSPDATSEEIATLNEEAEIAVPALMKVLGKKDDPVRGQAAAALGAFRAHADIVVPTLIATLQDENKSNDGAHAATAAADALGQFGHDAQAAVPALVLALKSPSLDLHSAAAAALKKIAPEAAAKAGAP